MISKRKYYELKKNHNKLWKRIAYILDNRGYGYQFLGYMDIVNIKRTAFYDLFGDNKDIPVNTCFLCEISYSSDSGEICSVCPAKQFNNMYSCEDDNSPYRLFRKSLLLDRDYATAAELAEKIADIPFYSYTQYKTIFEERNQYD